jgi:hypothetical protein
MRNISRLLAATTHTALQIFLLFVSAACAVSSSTFGGDGTRKEQRLVPGDSSLLAPGDNTVATDQVNSEALVAASKLGLAGCQPRTCFEADCRSVAFGIEVDPALESGILPQSFSDVELKAAQLKSVALKSSGILTGEFKSQQAKMFPQIMDPTANADNSDKRYDIVVTHAPGVLRRNVVETNLEPNNTFSLNLLMGLEYRGVLFPEGRHGLIPHFFSLQMDSADQKIVMNLPNEHTIISGRLSLPSKDPTGLDFAVPYSVMALQAGRLVSAIGAMNPKGSFMVSLSNPLPESLSTAPIVVRLEPAEPSSYMPSFERVIEQHALGGEDRLDLGSIEFGSFGRLTSLHLRVVSIKDLRPVPGTHVRLKANISNGIFVRDITVDDKGEATILVLSGVYDVTMTPPAQSPFAPMVKLGLSVGQNMAGPTAGGEVDAVVDGTDESAKMPSAPEFNQELKLLERQTLNGVLRDAGGQPVEGAQVKLIPLQHGAQQFEFRTDKNGNFCRQSSKAEESCAPAYLDAGLYRVVVAPPDGRQLPSLFSKLDFPKQHTLDMRLNPGHLIGGTILAPDGKTGVAQAFVRVYAPSKTELAGSLVPIGTAFTDSQGHYSLCIPKEY